MRKYDYLFCPSPDANGEWTVEGMADLEQEPVEHIIGPVIVLTIEELRDIWDKGYVRGCEEFGLKHLDMCDPTTPNFNEYLISKGIQLP